jgi:preprotein translocase subunit SecA
MNIQRNAIYKKRYNALSGERLAIDLNNMFTGLINNLIAGHKNQGNFESFRAATIETLGIDPTLTKEDFEKQSIGNLIDIFFAQFQEFYERKAAHIAEVLMPTIHEVYNEQGHIYKRIAVPFTDGRMRALTVAADLEDAIQSDGQSLMNDIEKAITLAILDDEWKEHLRSMDELKESVQGASFEQKDPLVIYKMEAYELFERLIAKINLNVTSYLSRGFLLMQDHVEEAPTQQIDYGHTNRELEEAEARREAQRNAGANVSEPSRPKTVVRDVPKVGRNEPCPCGSGKKYKNCHGKDL